MLGFILHAAANGTIPIAGVRIRKCLILPRVRYKLTFLNELRSGAAMIIGEVGRQPDAACKF